jgi:hypothetical protein
MAEDWAAPTVSLDRGWEGMATILRQVGYDTTGSLLEYGASTQFALSRRLLPELEKDHLKEDEVQF